MMMKKMFAISALALLLAAVSGCGSTPRQSSVSNQSTDSEITANIKAAAKNDAALNASAMTVETSNGAVQLSGFVGTYAEVTAASSIARGIAGVTSVNNNMMVKAIR